MPQLHFARYRSELKFTHYLFRFPAKFHPPALRCLIARFSQPGDTILDPFCGSGTLLVEALLAGRHAIGLDVDPLATFISRVKCTPIPPAVLDRQWQILKRDLQTIRRSPCEYDRLIHDDLSASAIQCFRCRLDIPDLPNIEHWFRTYVVLDLARLRNAIWNPTFTARVRNFFLGCFASIIRNASNADPVPVSGLEVTAHMKRLEEQGRRIDPFELFERRVERELRGMLELFENATDATTRVECRDATTLPGRITPGSVDVVITSPPYNTAVDYYRRHTLEMYWLGLVSSYTERVELASKYLGRVQVRQTNARLLQTFESGYIRRLIAHARQISPERERAVTHYCASMQRAVQNIAQALKPGGRAVFVLGNSKWNGRRVRATKLLCEIASSDFDISEVLTYSAQNRYMSYKRRNGADINREYALVLIKQ